MTSLVAEYVETFESFRRQKEQTPLLHPALEEVFEAELLRIWNEMSVEECEAVERRYPELRIRRYG